MLEQLASSCRRATGMPASADGRRAPDSATDGRQYRGATMPPGTRSRKPQITEHTDESERLSLPKSSPDAFRHSDSGCRIPGGANRTRALNCALDLQDAALPTPPIRGGAVLRRTLLPAARWTGGVAAWDVLTFGWCGAEVQPTGPAGRCSSRATVACAGILDILARCGLMRWAHLTCADGFAW